MRSLSLLALFLVACGRAAPSGGAEIAVEGAPPIQVETLRTRLVPVSVDDLYERRRVRFLAVPAVELLDERFGPGWREADEVVFGCADGYRAGVSVERLLRHRAHLALAREDADFSVEKRDGDEVERVPLAPAYLVWEPVEGGAEVGWEWPYQIVSIEIASEAERYARMRPPEPASPEVARGFATFRTECARCHSINGDGGRVGPELNFPASITEYMDEAWIERFILEPRSVRFRTAMPGLSKHVDDRETRARELVAYLRAMAGRKLPPGEE